MKKLEPTINITQSEIEQLCPCMILFNGLPNKEGRTLIGCLNERIIKERESNP